MILDKIVLVKALQQSTPSTGKETWVTFSGFLNVGQPSPYVRMNIQPASPQFTALSEGQMFKTFKAFTLASGVTENMLLTVSGTQDTYRVRGREVFNYGAGQHFELTLAKETI